MTTMPTMTASARDRAEIVLELFTEIAILERLSQSRVNMLTPAGLSCQQFGILNHFIRIGRPRIKLSTLAWVFQDPEHSLEEDVARLASMGLLEVDEHAGGPTLQLTDAGAEKHRQAFVHLAPSFSEMLADFPTERLHQASETLVEIRRTMDNQPDR